MDKNTAVTLVDGMKEGDRLNMLVGEVTTTLVVQKVDEKNVTLQNETQEGNPITIARESLIASLEDGTFTPVVEEEAPQQTPDEQPAEQKTDEKADDQGIPEGVGQAEDKARQEAGDHRQRGPRTKLPPLDDVLKALDDVSDEDVKKIVEETKEEGQTETETETENQGGTGEENTGDAGSAQVTPDE